MNQEPITIEGDVVLRKIDTDWYTIERAEHENRHWMERVQDDDIGSYTALRYSGRISDADVEGTAEEMRGIAKAIRERRAYCNARRCAVDATGNEVGTVVFYSPRNSMRHAHVSRAAAEKLAQQIESELSKP